MPAVTITSPSRSTTCALATKVMRRRCSSTCLTAASKCFVRWLISSPFSRGSAGARPATAPLAVSSFASAALALSSDDLSPPVDLTGQGERWRGAGDRAEQLAKAQAAPEVDDLGFVRRGDLGEGRARDGRVGTAGGGALRHRHVECRDRPRHGADLDEREAVPVGLDEIDGLAGDGRGGHLRPDRVPRKVVDQIRPEVFDEARTDTTRDGRLARQRPCVRDRERPIVLEEPLNSVFHIDLHTSGRFHSSCASRASNSRWACSAAACSPTTAGEQRSEEHTSELQSRLHLVCRLLLEKKK